MAIRSRFRGGSRPKIAVRSIFRVGLRQIAIRARFRDSVIMESIGGRATDNSSAGIERFPKSAEI